MDKASSKRRNEDNGTVVLQDSYQYDSLGNISKITHRDGKYEEYSYDSQSQLTGVVYKSSSGTVLSSESYTVTNSGII